MQVISSKKLKRFFPSALFKEQRKQRLEGQRSHGRAGLRAALALPRCPGFPPACQRAGTACAAGFPGPPGRQQHEWLWWGSSKQCLPGGALHPCPFGKEPKQQIVPLPPGTCLASGCSSRSPALTPFSQRLIWFPGHRAAAALGPVCCRGTWAPLLLLGPFWHLLALPAPCSSLELINKQSWL